MAKEATCTAAAARRAGRQSAHRARGLLRRERCRAARAGAPQRRCASAPHRAEPSHDVEDGLRAQHCARAARLRLVPTHTVVRFARSSNPRSGTYALLLQGGAQQAASHRRMAQFRACIKPIPLNVFAAYASQY